MFLRDLKLIVFWIKVLFYFYQTFAPLFSVLIDGATVNSVSNLNPSIHSRFFYIFPYITVKSLFFFFFSNLQLFFFFFFSLSPLSLTKLRLSIPIGSLRPTAEN